MSHRTHHLPICTHVDDRRVRQRTPFSNTCVSKTLAIAKRSGMTLITTIYWLVQRTTNQALIAGCSSHPTSDKAVEPLSSNHNPPLPPILDTVSATRPCRARVHACARVPDTTPMRPRGNDTTVRGPAVFPVSGRSVATAAVHGRGSLGPMRCPSWTLSPGGIDWARPRRRRPAPPTPTMRWPPRSAASPPTRAPLPRGATGWPPPLPSCRA